jgi:Cu/Ag efflux pump CusA
MAFTFSQPIQRRIDELVAGTRAQLIVKLFGDDTEVLRRKAGDMASILGGIRGAADLVVERVAGQPYLTVTVDRDKVARYGVNAGDVLKVIELGIGGRPLSTLYQQNRTFDSVWLASLVLINLPFAAVGGVFALFLTGLYLLVPASMGFIVLFGVAVLNGVVLISYLSDLRDKGASAADAVRTGYETRLRPVLMTASIAIFSLIPMVFATGPGSEVQRWPWSSSEGS